MKIINKTAHKIVLVMDLHRSIVLNEAKGDITYLKKRIMFEYKHEFGFEVKSEIITGIENVPSKQEDTIYIVDKEVAMLLPLRNDIFYCKPSTDQRFNKTISVDTLYSKYQSS